MQSQSRAGHRLAKGAAACQICRRRKQNCDLKYPNCSNCEGAHVPCLTYHSRKQAEIPRNYVANLEAQLEKLTQQNQDLQRENQELQRQTQSPSVNPESYAAFEPSSPAECELSCTPTEIATAFDESTGRLQDVVKSVRNVVAEPSGQPRFLGPSSGITLAKMVIASIRSDTLLRFPSSSRQRPTASSTSNSASAPTPLPAPESSLPPRHAANHLVDVYFQYRTPHLPIVERSQVEPAIESAYLFLNGHQSPGRVIERDVFMMYMIFAIALCNVPNPSGGTVRVLQSEGCFRSAAGWIEKVITYSKSDLETLRLVLLLAYFVSMCPWQGILWHLTGIAVRLCTDIGLHWESEEQPLNMDPDVLYERRRLWYAAYHFDRVLGITLGRPFGIPDESTRVPLPHSWAASRRPLGQETDDFDIHHQRAHNHLFSMAKLESEIKHVQQSQTWPVKMANPKPNYAPWVEDIQPRLQEWYSTIPDPGKAHPSSIFANQAYWDYTYNNAILLLYRPNSSAQHLPIEALTISHEAACKLIASIKILQREGRVDVLWKTAHQLFMAGLTVIYCLWQRWEMRDRYAVGSSISTLQTCAATLSAMSETFHGVAGCRDIFETLSTVTVDCLFNSDDEIIRQSRLDFDKQVEDLLQQLQPSRGNLAMPNENGANNISNMLSTDVFSEMLSSAAQWPEYQGGEFGDGGMDSDEIWFP